MDYEAILVRKAGPVATVTMNRPEALNFLDPIMAQEIESALADFEKDEEVRAVIITGAGRAFCAGGDVKFMKQEWPVYDLVVRMERVTGFIKAMLDLPKPILPRSTARRSARAATSLWPQIWSWLRKRRPFVRSSLALA